MDYRSTRGGNMQWGPTPSNFSDTVLAGLAVDGGLAVPATYPKVNVNDLPDDYAQCATAILSRFAPDISVSDWQTMTGRVYHKKNFLSSESPDAITPLARLDENLAILELSNGPTLAFKDIALQLLGELFSRILAKENRSLNILGATSGDTGSSAEYALRGRERIAVFMLSPKGRMSPFQSAQMFSLPDANIFNLAIEGVFDDCQNIVKALSEDTAFKERAKLGAVNSINWARIAAQVVYYFVGYRRAKDSGMKNISFVVPSGNFGNVFAGHVARMMGLPIHRLIVATNENNVLETAINQGIYRPRPSSAVQATSSPSMDIAKSSNFERYVYDLCGRDGEYLSRIWAKMERQGEINFHQEGLMPQIADSQKHPQTALVAGVSHHAERVQTIRATYERYRRLIDPHTADAMGVGLRLQEREESLVILETAQPLKFGETILEALPALAAQHPPFASPLSPSLSHLADLLDRPQKSYTLPASADAVRQFIEKNI